MAAGAGFGDATFHFLDQLEKNNDRAWFNANKSRYEDCILTPALDYIAAMQPLLGKLAPHFTAIPQRVGGSLMRIYRDTRFAKDKSPYKTNIGIQFRHEQAKDVHAPGYYVHIATDGCFLAAGMWHPEPQALASVRDRIVAKPADWKRVRDGRAFTAAFELQGDSLARPPRGYAADHPMMDDLKRKDFIAVRDVARDGARQSDFAAQSARTFKAATPLMQFLCAAVGVAY